MKRAPAVRKPAGRRGRLDCGSWFSPPGSDRACDPSLPKVLHRVAGRTLVDAVHRRGRTAFARPRGRSSSGRERRAHREGAPREGAGLEFVVQDPPLGTGDASRARLRSAGQGRGPDARAGRRHAAADAPRRWRGWSPAAERGLDLVFLSFRPPEPGDFGRVVRDCPRPRARHRRGEERLGAARRRSARSTPASIASRRKPSAGRSRGIRAEPGRPGVLPDRRDRDPGGGRQRASESRGDRGRGLARGLGRQHAARSRGGRGDGAPPRHRPRARRGRDRARSRDRAHRARRPLAPDVVLHPSSRSRARRTSSRGLRGLLLHAPRRHAGRRRRGGRARTAMRGSAIGARARVGSVLPAPPGLGHRARRRASATSSRPRATTGSAGERRRCTSRTSATRTWAPAPTSARE